MREIEADLRFHRGILTAAHNDLIVQMGGVIGVGLLTSFRISPQSFAVFLALHRHVFRAIRDRKSRRGARGDGGAAVGDAASSSKASSAQSKKAGQGRPAAA